MKNIVESVSDVNVGGVGVIQPFTGERMFFDCF
jgi:hypothetical protein